MNIEPGSGEVIWPLVVYGGIALLISAGMIIVSHFLGQRHEDQATQETYESGIETTHDARLRFPIHFYIVAMFFVIFDLEAVFIFAWAVSIQEVGWAGYCAAVVFIGILLAVLVYEWRIGAIDFGPKGKEILKAMKRKNKIDKT